MSSTVGNGRVPYDDLYHETPVRQAHTKYMAAAPKTECDRASFDSRLSSGITYGEPAARVKPSQDKNVTPQSDVKKTTFVPAILMEREGNDIRFGG